MIFLSGTEENEVFHLKNNRTSKSCIVAVVGISSVELRYGNILWSGRDPRHYNLFLILNIYSRWYYLICLWNLAYVFNVRK